MIKDFTKDEARAFLQSMDAENDIVRLVDPVAQRVIDDDFTSYLSGQCCRLWGRCERCENCTSLRALKQESRAFKLEVLDHKTFWIQSRFMRIEGKPFIAEIVSDVSQNLIMDTDRNDEIGAIIGNYNHLLITDALTGAMNRRFLDEHFLPSLKCCHERGLLVNLAVMDIDSFKSVNDIYGHQAGDLLLKDVAGFWNLHFNSRKKDKERLTIRYGGDEFLIVTCGIQPERFRDEVAKYYGQMRKICYYTDTIQIPFTLTYGISSSTEFKGSWTWDELFVKADKRMYAEKQKRKSVTGGI